MSLLSRRAAPQGALAPFAALVAGAVAMGASPIFVRLADVGPFSSAFWRVTLALPLLYAWMRSPMSATKKRIAAVISVASKVSRAAEAFFRAAWTARK